MARSCDRCATTLRAALAQLPGVHGTKVSFEDRLATLHVDGSFAPGTVVETHTHPFAVRALVLRGELWLDCRGGTRHLVAGDRFELERDEPHAERYGADGARYRVARRR